MLMHADGHQSTRDNTMPPGLVAPSPDKRAAVGGRVDVPYEREAFKAALLLLSTYHALVSKIIVWQLS